MTIRTTERNASALTHRRASRRRSLAAATLLASGAAVASAYAQVTHETADVFGQGMNNVMNVVSQDGATLLRSDTGLTANLRMPTPAPGTYLYPEVSGFHGPPVSGHPEAYSFWVFVFNMPEECQGTGGCDFDDFVAGRGAPGAFNAGGHIVGGPHLQLSGRVTERTEPFPGAPAHSQNPVFAPRMAEVHLAVAPHGALQQDGMPAQITTPVGNVFQHWWLALFPRP